MADYEINNVNLITSWTFKLDKNQDCTICRQSLNSYSIYAKDMNLSEIKLYTGICGHTFHEECIRPWLQTQNKCPICSTPNFAKNY